MSLRARGLPLLLVFLAACPARTRLVGEVSGPPEPPAVSVRPLEPRTWRGTRGAAWSSGPGARATPGRCASSAARTGCRSTRRWPTRARTAGAASGSSRGPGATPRPTLRGRLRRARNLAPRPWGPTARRRPHPIRTPARARRSARSARACRRPAPPWPAPAGSARCGSPAWPRDARSARARWRSRSPPSRAAPRSSRPATATISVAALAAVTGATLRRSAVVIAELEPDGSLAPVDDPLVQVQEALRRGARRVVLPLGGGTATPAGAAQPVDPDGPHQTMPAAPCGWRPT